MHPDAWSRRSRHVPASAERSREKTEAVEARLAVPRAEESLWKEVEGTRDWRAAEDEEERTEDEKEIRRERGFISPLLLPLAVLPGCGQREEAVRGLTLHLECYVQRLDVSQRKEVEAALDWYAEQVDEIVREPSYVPPLKLPSALLPHVATQYLASITDSLSEYFLCRKYDTYVLRLVVPARSLASFFRSEVVASARRR